jgi:hypothetical protein
MPDRAPIPGGPGGFIGIFRAYSARLPGTRPVGAVRD